MEFDTFSRIGSARALPRADRRDPVRALLFKLAETGCEAVSAAIPAARVERERLSLGRVEAPVLNLPSNFEGYRIVHLSDFHFIDDISYQVASRAIEMAVDLAPDLIVYTGDFVTRYIDSERIVDTLKPLRARDGVWAVLGNHDYWDAAAKLRALLARTPVRELCNANHAIRRGDQTLWVAGVDDVLEGYPDLESALCNIPKSAPVILLAHEPDYVETVSATGHVSLMLAGHSHGGQIVVPGYGPVLLPAGAQRYWQGLYKVEDTSLYVTRGVGTHSSLRFNCRPEVTEITLSSGE
jgi:predicted MPP superfamily phosphohydrolase